MNPSRILRFLLGSTLGLLILGLAAAGMGFWLVQRLSAPPARPVFDNERSLKPSPSPSKKPPSSAPRTSATATPTPLPKGSYRATVNFPSGLSVRSAPKSDATRVGGVDFAEEVLVLETSDDAQWQRIRVDSSGEEGWIKAGNIKRLDAQSQ